MRAIFVLTLTLYATAAFSADSDSANWVMVGCRHSIRDSQAENFRQGVCAGTVRALVNTDPQICAPQGATGGQSIRIVVQYIEAVPARHHENFVTLALEAMRKAWPCARRPNSN